MRNSGFTLIELLIVLVIIAIVASVVTLTVGRNQVWQEKTLVEEMVEVLNSAKDYALLEPATVQVLIDPHRVQFRKWHVTEKMPRGEFVPIEESYLQPIDIGQGERLYLDVHAVGPKKSSRSIIISINGDWTPFDLWIGPASGAHYRLQGTVGGGMRVVPVNEAGS
jgi:prepilin-type N-terminal cleavage/methylation domain-containing protein